VGFAQGRLTRYLAVAAATWGIAMGLAPILQIRSILKHSSSTQVSVGYMLVLLVGFFLWLGYGIAKDDLAIIIPNCVAAAVIIATILVARRFRVP
jgi:MtN3 and saliva related transmembrane protein